MFSQYHGTELLQVRQTFHNMSDMIERWYYKSMVAVLAVLITVCAYFLQGIFRNSEAAYEYMIGHDRDYKHLRKEVDKINQALDNGELTELYINQK